MSKGWTSNSEPISSSVYRGLIQKEPDHFWLGGRGEPALKTFGWKNKSASYLIPGQSDKN